MKIHLLSILDTVPDQNEDIVTSLTPNVTSYIQDTVHIGTKLRNLLLKPSVLLPMGTKQVSVSHLKVLIKKIPKDIHGIVMSDICPVDRQNYASLEKLMKARVLESMQQNIVDSEATVMYLKLCKSITSSFSEYDLTPLERIYRIWHALFYLRIWRKWIMTQKDENGKKLYTLTNNFISTNAFSCVEINAHGLIHTMIKFRNENTPHYFLPTIFQSQTCENVFRQLRSMGTVNWTKINFTMYELIHMIGRWELQTDIIYNKLNGSGVSFPRHQNRPEKYKFYELPNDEQIRNALKSAQNDAFLDMARFGIEDIQITDIQHCLTSNRKLPIHHALIEEDDTDSETENDNELDLPMEEDDFSDIDSNDSSILDAKSRFVEVFDNNGVSKIVRKSSVIWQLTESKHSLSSDRLRRVQNNILEKSRKVPIVSMEDVSEMLSRSKYLTVGEWCFFYRPKTDISSKPKSKRFVFENLMLGSIMGFKYIDGSNEKDKQYTLNFAPVEDNHRGINALATWYTCSASSDSDLILHQASQNNHFFITTENYVCTSKYAVIQDQYTKKYKLDCDFADISSDLFKIFGTLN